MASSGMLLVLSSPSGGGKSTLGRLCLDRVDNLVYSVSYTSREPRGREQDGVDYHFVSRAEFMALAEGGFFLEWEEVHGNLYGTGKEAVQSLLRIGKDVLLDIDVQGGLRVRELMPDCTVLAFILPPSREALRQRLEKRATDAEEVVRLRMANANKEILTGQEYDYLIVNDDIERAVHELCCLVIAERCRMNRQDDFWRNSGFLEDVF
jgi:guanylate kinase